VTLNSGLGIIQGHLKMAPFESFGTVSYLHSIATMAVSSSRFNTIHERDIQPGHCTTAQATLMHSIARQKHCRRKCSKGQTQGVHEIIRYVVWTGAKYSNSQVVRRSCTSLRGCKLSISAANVTSRVVRSSSDLYSRKRRNQNWLT